MKRVVLPVACALGAFTAEAHAQVDNTGVLDQALTQYRTAAESWQNAAQSAATTLFWSLAAISLAWTMGQLVLRRAELGEFFAELIRYVLFTGFWAWMLANGPAHAQLIVDSMVRLASSASSQNRLTPSGILDVGFHILDRTLTQSTISSPLISAIGILVALGILIVLALAAVNMLVSLIACWIVAYGGLIILGFGGSRWTSDMAINYYRMVLSLGLQVLAMVLLVGMGESFLRNYFDRLEQDVSLHELAVLLVVSLVLLVTVNRVPALLGTLANGSSPQYALGGGAGVGAAMSTISTVGGLAAWSLGTGRTVADGAGQLVLGAGSLAKAMAAATTGGASSAMTSLLDGFRSGGADRSSGTATAGGGGSVFPAAATPANSHAIASSRTSSAPDASQPAGHADGGTAPARTANPDVPRTADAPAKAANSAAPRTSVDSQRQAAVDRRPGARSGATAEPSARPHTRPGKVEASVAGAVVPTTPDAHANAAAPIARDQGTPSTADRSTRTGKPDPIVSVASSERPDAGSNRAVPAAATPPFNAINSAATPAQPTSAVSAPTTTSAPPAPISTATAPIAPSRVPQSTALTNLVAAATSATASPQDIPFSIAANSGPVQPSNKPTLPTVAEPSGRAELQPAYSEQSAVDIEAEVAAFRDKD